MKSIFIQIVRYFPFCFFSFFSIVYWLFLQFLPSKNGPLNHFFNLYIAIIYFAFSLHGFTLLKKIDVPLVKKVFQFFTLSIFVYSLGSFVWFCYNFFLKTDIPFPSIADLFFVLFPVFIGAAFWHIFEIFRFTPSKTNMKLSFLIIILVFIVIFFIFNKTPFTSDQSLLAIILNLFYPISDSFLITIGIIALTTISQRCYGLFFITVGILSMAIGDISFSYRQNIGIYWNGDISDLFFVQSGIFISLGLKILYDRFKSKEINLPDNTSI